MFIKLTGRKTNSTLILLISKIVVVDSAIDTNGNMGSAIRLDSIEGHFAAKETPEQIMEMIENARN